MEKKLARPESRNGKPQTANPPKLVQLPPMALATDKNVHLETPWEYFGIFKDDPTWMPMFEEIERRRNRQKIPKAKKIFADLLKKFKSKKRYADMMIAAMALAGHHVVITRNIKHFTDLLPLAQLANWIDEPPR